MEKKKNNNDKSLSTNTVSSDRWQHWLWKLRHCDILNYMGNFRIYVVDYNTICYCRSIPIRGLCKSFIYFVWVFVNWKYKF